MIQFILWEDHFVCYLKKWTIGGQASSNVMARVAVSVTEEGRDEALSLSSWVMC